MALIIEDGTGKLDSQSYASAATLTAYATARAITLTAATDAAKEALLIRAMDYIESQPYRGIKNTQAQALQWPRYAVFIDGYLIGNDTIPQQLIDALCEVAIGVDGGVNPLANEERAVKREAVDVIEVEYMDGARDSTYLVAAETKLKKLLLSGSGVSAMVIRA